MRARVLVVDDDPAGAEALGILLWAEGFEPSFVTSADRALGAFRVGKPDLVLLDVMLPGADGIDVCRRIRAESGIPIVILTARSDPSDVVLGLESGADDYVVKPFQAAGTGGPNARPAAADRPVPGDPGDRRPADRPHRPRGVQTRDRHPVDPAGVRAAGRAGSSPAPGFTREQLLEQVWGYRHAADTRLVNAHVQRLRSKIERDPGRPEVVVTIRGVGYQAGSS